MIIVDGTKVYPNDDPATAAKKLANDIKKEGWYIDAKTDPKDLNKQNNRNKSTAEERKKFVIPTFKYSKIGKRDLYESVILGGIPTFLRYDQGNNRIMSYRSIEEETRILRPPSPEEYPYTPYEFASLEELDEFLEYAKTQTIHELFRLALNFIKLYNDQDEHKQILLAADVVLSH